MILGFIFSILSVTYSVASGNSVAVSGTEPEGSVVHYQRSSTTGRKGQMTSGNTTQLDLQGWDGCALEEVELQMCSNSAQGAGWLEMTIGDDIVWWIGDAAFSSAAWNGSYSSTWVPIRGRMGVTVGAGDPIRITIGASENSLYIDSYTIRYRAKEPAAYEVRLETGLGDSPMALTEETIGSGVVLPEWVDTLQWHFAGWSEVEVLEGDTCPTLWKAGDRYFPKSDCRLWAVYMDGEGSRSVCESVSGEYVLVSKYWQVAMQGGVENGEIKTKGVTLQEQEEGACTLLAGAREEMVYRIDFVSDSILKIWNEKHGEAIGYAGSRLAEGEMLWQYQWLADGSLGVYYADGARHRMLYMGYGSSGVNDEIVAYVTRVDMENMVEGGVLLFGTQEVVFTSWPFGKLDGVEDVFFPGFNGEKEVLLWQIGGYELWVKNGEKVLIVR